MADEARRERGRQSSKPDPTPSHRHRQTTPKSSKPRTPTCRHHPRAQEDGRVPCEPHRRIQLLRVGRVRRCRRRLQRVGQADDGKDGAVHCVRNERVGRLLDGVEGVKGVSAGALLAPYLAVTRRQAASGCSLCVAAGLWMHTSAAGIDGLTHSPTHQTNRRTPPTPRQFHRIASHVPAQVLGVPLLRAQPPHPPKPARRRRRHSAPALLLHPRRCRPLGLLLLCARGGCRCRLHSCCCCALPLPGAAHV